MSEEARVKKMRQWFEYLQVEWYLYLRAIIEASCSISGEPDERVNQKTK